MTFKSFSRENYKSLVSLVIIVFLFFCFSYLVQNYLDFFKGYLDFGFFGMFVYLFISFLVTVFAPVSNFPLVPIASNLWGWPVAGLLDLIGWYAASIVAFVIARKYGSKIVSRLVPIDNITRLESMISEKDRFWAAVILRLLVPVDLVSYAFGLFSKISFRTYALSSLIGIAPYAFAIAYVGSLNLITQIIALLAGGILLLIVWIFNVPEIRRRYLEGKK